MKALKAIALVAAGALSMLGVLMILADWYEELPYRSQGGSSGAWTFDE